MRLAAPFLFVVAFAAGSAAPLAFANPDAVADNEVAKEKIPPDQWGKSTASTLQTIRCQLELYAIQHNASYPTLDKLADWSALTCKTNADGCEGTSFGPYLSAVPVNPFTGQSQVVAGNHANSGAGWTWDDKRHILRAIVPRAAIEQAKTLDKSDIEIAEPDTPVPDPVEFFPTINHASEATA